ncbi:SPFH domain-containing protein [Hazenella coriacea]|uniref:SPFH domain-containing protein n=1 Tax=Hazenella coriacea TaxID=1179467 RepID=UPI001A9FE9DF|nr:SPFH domain-containing protein [Hazenella coriacea]
MEEKQAWKANGFLFILLAIGLAIGGGLLLINENGVGAVLVVVAILLLPGFVIVQPNEARVLIFFGNYIGNITEDGFHWANPFAIKKRISLRVRNFNSDKLKVNDANGNPILIGAVVVWKVVDSAKALFDVDDYEEFVDIQSETAIRALASNYPYDSHEPGVSSLRGVPEEVGEALRTELQERLNIAGVEVLEARISHLAYAPEIAQAMLRRQQAQAVIAARKEIVEGAMGMVEMALKHLEGQGVVELDEERKAAMVNNLLVALVSEGETHPVINTGSLYQ